MVGRDSPAPPVPLKGVLHKGNKHTHDEHADHHIHFMGEPSSSKRIPGSKLKPLSHLEAGDEAIVWPALEAAGNLHKGTQYVTTPVQPDSQS